MASATGEPFVDVSVIIITYRNVEVAVRAIESALSAVKECGLSGEVIVVDNGSPTDVVAQLARYPVNLITLGANLGFAKANNVGARRARGRVLLFVNSDAFLSADALQCMIRNLASVSTMGAVGPLEVDAVGNPRRTWWPKPNPVLDPMRRGLLRLRVGRVEVPKQPRITVPYLPGFCVALRREAFESVGGWPENYTFYGEDVILGYKLRKAGWLQAVVTECRVVHLGGASTPETERLSRLFRSRRKMYRETHGRLGELLFLATWFILLIPTKAFRRLSTWIAQSGR
ncbi:glycosyltransferase family 2 protein [Carboxydochorda subterranea]|uniref:Glycosyltransferase family 2 protein n=1 Tax=Carboxydichorda subterranea TaxID=3109565 RepID=A0ABZ1C1S0_9FIRM|nr:glycosyltransferase family 2 protein [Limnochorda sp. L945t]WRP18828.1 glycosyltransferase family 2 protein [Limnochorda sp. L945t]